MVLLCDFPEVVLNHHACQRKKKDGANTAFFAGHIVHGLTAGNYLVIRPRKNLSSINARMLLHLLVMFSVNSISYIEDCFHYRCVKNLSECCHNSQAGQNLGTEIRRIELPVGCLVPVRLLET